MTPNSDDDVPQYIFEEAPEGISREVIDTLNADLKQLSTMWKVFEHWSLNTAEGSPVGPTALFGFAFAMVHRSHHETNGYDASCTDDDMSVLMSYASFGSTMFKFGQMCSNNGVLAANMMELFGEAFTDEAIRKLLGNGN